MSKKVSGWPLIAPTEVDTSITGDQVMEALAADVEASDSGKVLTATYSGLEGEKTGSVMWASPLPLIAAGDAGKVLTVNAGETGAEWEEASGGGVAILYGGGSTETVTFTATANTYSSYKVEFNTANYIGKEIVAVFAQPKLGFTQNYWSDITISCGEPSGGTSGNYYPANKIITTASHSFYISVYNSGDTNRSLSFKPVAMLIKL